jgi:hypothetical protein
MKNLKIGLKLVGGFIFVALIVLVVASGVDASREYALAYKQADQSSAVAKAAVAQVSTIAAIANGNGNGHGEGSGNGNGASIHSTVLAGAS